MGELVVRGPWVAAGYYNDERSAASFTSDGWFRTGDIVKIHPNGYIEIADRTKDVIKSGGEWISSVALENALMAHPKVQEAAVIAVPDERWTERPMACIVARPEFRGEVLDAGTGKLTNKGYIPTGGKTPRHFAIDPSGKYLLAENQDSNNIVVFKINPATGGLTATGQEVKVPAPVCIVFVAAN